MVPPASRAPGAPPPRDPAWARGVNHLAYRLGRPLERAAVIGVGGGRDLLAALACGARHVDGYELNALLLELLRDTASRWNDLARWPEVSLVHGEARVEIARAGRRYDVIQASMIDTWAATASGGMVLAENGLYTLEGWRGFVDALSERGVLTLTRWYLPDEPGETLRLVSLAARTLQAEGVAAPRRHVALLAEGEGPVRLATLLLSRSPFTPDEVTRLQELAASEGFEPLVLPGATPTDATMDALLDPERRAAAIAASRFDLSAPTDLRPYFFLVNRPGDIDLLRRETLSPMTEATTAAARTLLALAGLTALFSLAVFALATSTLPGPAVDARQRRAYRWSLAYFFAIGLGYVLVQLALHHRLILVLGHPTTALAVVLAAMLLGSGAGARASARFPAGRFGRAWATILAVLLGSLAALPLVPLLETLPAAWLRTALVTAWVASVGFVLGFGFPLGVRLVAWTGPHAVQKGWAVNGAASIAGGAAAAVVSVALGSHAVFAAGAACYALVLLCGLRAQALASAVEPAEGQ